MSLKRPLSCAPGDENLHPCKREEHIFCAAAHQRPWTPLLSLAASAQNPAPCRAQPQSAACRPVDVARPDPAGGASPADAKPARRLPGRLAQPKAAPASLPALTLAECRVVYVATAVEVEWWANRFLQDPRLTTVALDIEWRVTFKTGETPRPAAVVQLAYKRPAPLAGQPPYTCVLLHVALAGLTPALRTLLQSPQPAMVGVGIHGDALKMQRDWGLTVGGVVDLSEIALDRGVTRSGEPTTKWSLADLSERVLQRRLAKLPALRLSDWEAAPLSQAQAVYAALDAFACLRIHEALQHLPVLQSVLDARAAAAAAAAAQHANNADAFAARSTMAAAARVEDFVPAVPAPRPLQPAKQAVYAAFHQQGMSIAAIAELRHVQPSTVCSYLAEAVLGGHAYHWRRFGVSDAALAAIEDAAAAILLPAPRGPAASVDTPASAAVSAAPASVSAAATAQPQSGVGESLHDTATAWATGVFADASDDDEDEALLAATLAEPAAAVQIGLAAVQDSSAAGILAQWLPPLQSDTAAAPAAVCGARALKERLAVDVDCGHIRLALAHLGRTSPRFAALTQQVDS